MGTFGELKKKGKKASYTDIAYEAIKELIYNEEIKPGEMLSENQLSEYLNISRTPVREAIRRLEAEGILDVRQGLGTFLKILTVKDIRDIYEVRESMELLAAQTAIKHTKDEEIKELQEELVHLLEEYHTTKEINQKTFAEIDEKFHARLVENSENGYVKMLMRHINFNVNRYRLLSFRAVKDMEESINQHLRLLKHMEEKDTKAFLEELQKHIRWSWEGLSYNLNDRDI